jgi:sortase B
MRQKLITLICLVVIVVASWQLIDYFLTYEIVGKQEEELQNKIASSSLTQLQKQYDEMVGWIKINHTKVDYPIMQAVNNEFYLTHNYKGEKLRAGSIFLDYRNNPLLNDRHSIIYGHDLRNGSMFGQLHQYEEQSFTDANRSFTIELANKQLTLEVFSAYQTTTDFYYIETEFTNESYARFIETIKNKSVITYDGNITISDQIITLSTCVSDLGDERFVVHAKVVERKSD